MENFKGQHMLLLLLKKPAVVEAVTEILREMNIQSICLQGSEGTRIQAEKVSGMPFLGSFLGLMEQDQSEGKALLTVLSEERLEVFEKHCAQRIGELSSHQEMTALILPVTRSLGQQFKFAG